MNAREFFDIVAEMRAAQKRYFMNRTHSDLLDAKALEKTVDGEIEKVRHLEKAHGVENLIDGELC
jgi:hypothetical protein